MLSTWMAGVYNTVGLLVLWFY